MKMDLALSYKQRLICHKTKPHQTNYTSILDRNKNYWDLFFNYLFLLFA